MDLKFHEEVLYLRKLHMKKDKERRVEKTVEKEEEGGGGGRRGEEEGKIQFIGQFLKQLSVSVPAGKPSR